MLVVCIGNPLLDIVVSVSQELMDRFGLKPDNSVLAELKHIPLYEELVNNHKVEYIAGGAAQNSTRATQWMIQTPKSTAYIGCIGNDKFGQKLKEAAENDGVETHYLIDQNTPTGTCAVCVRDKERSLVANLSAANNYKKSHFDSEEIQDLIHRANLFYSTGFFLTVSPETSISLGEYACKSNKPFLFNLAAPFLVDFFYDGKMEVVLQYADVVFANEVEAETFGKKLGWGSDLSVIAQKLVTFPKQNKNRTRMVIFTQGSKQTIVAFDGEIRRFKPIPCKSEDIVDTNGAGDSFVGGFISRYVQGKSLDECIAAAHYCACECIKRSGCTYPPSPHFTYP